MSVLFSVEDHIARVTIDRPDVLNAVDLATQTELIRIWEAIEKNRDGLLRHWFRRLSGVFS